MVGLQYLATLSGGAAPFSVGITDLEITTIGGRVQLYSMNRPGAGGLGAYDITLMAAPVLLSQQGFRSGVTHLGVPQISVVHDGSAPFILPAGMKQSFAAAYAINANGQIGGQMRFAAPEVPPTDLIALSEISGGTQNFIVAARAGMAAPFVYEMAADHQLRLVSSAQGQASGDDLTGLASLHLGAAHIVLAISPLGNHVTSFQVDGAGRISQADRLESLASGLGFDMPGVLTTAMIGGTGYAILGSAGSSSLTVLRIGADGTMQPIEHVIDTLDTRFQGVSALETFTLGDRVFVLAGGADDGISLFTLLPDGRLIHLSALADMERTTLQNVTAIAATVVGDQVQIFVSSEGEAGISQFTLDIAAMGITQQDGAGRVIGSAGADLLIAGVATTGLSGGSGNDLLVAGAGNLEMRGGAGQDVFVARHNGATLTILDYETGVDRLDLSLFPMVRSLQQVQITLTPQGARIEFQTTAIEIIAAGHRPITMASFSDAEVLGLTRYTPPSPPAALTGTEAANRLDLEDAGGTALGLAGNDTITSGWGDAFIGGGPGNDWIRVISGQNRIWGGTGADTILGGSGEDEIYGGGSGANHLLGNGGNDTITGGGGRDLIAGGAGNDRLFGGAGDDTIYLGLGDDFVGGGAGNDLIIGGAGRNVIYTGTGADTVEGGSGADWIKGAGGANRLFGYGGDDWISGGDWHDLIAGGAGNDRLFGGAGNDALYLGFGNDFAGGGAGHDLIVGGAGNNRIYGGAGNDTIHTGTGRDVMTGGPGADVFVFASAAHAGIGAMRDVITDFEAGVDHLDLSALGLRFIGPAPFGGRAGDLRYIPGFVLGDLDGDGITDLTIQLVGVSALTAGDFIF